MLLVVAFSVGLYVVVAAAMTLLQELVRTAAGFGAVVHSSTKQVISPQISVAMDSMSEITVSEPPSISVNTSPGFVNSSLTTETAFSLSDTILSRIWGARVGIAVMNDVMSLKPLCMSSQTSDATLVARSSKAPGTLPSSTSQTNCPACCSSFSSS